MLIWNAISWPPSARASGGAMRETLKRYAKGEIPLARVFLHDMLLVGTIINVITGGLALIAYASGAQGYFALAILPLPYNIVLCVGSRAEPRLPDAGGNRPP